MVSSHVEVCQEMRSMLTEPMQYGVSLFGVALEAVFKGRSERTCLIFNELPRSRFRRQCSAVGSVRNTSRTTMSPIPKVWTTLASQKKENSET